MYANDTILTLKEQREPDEETGEECPYNRVKVVGRSPIDHGLVEKNPDGSPRWLGDDASGVILSPLSNFGSTLDEPFGKLRTLYDVESVPEVTVEVANPIRVIDSSSEAAGPTPEQVFATEAPGVAPDPGQKRGRTGVSPLGDVANPATKGPLD